LNKTTSETAAAHKDSKCFQYPFHNCFTLPPKPSLARTSRDPWVAS